MNDVGVMVPVEQAIRRVVAEFLGVSAEDLVPEVSLVDDLAADSLDLIEMGLALEVECDVVLDDRLLESVRTYRELVDAVLAAPHPCVAPLPGEAVFASDRVADTIDYEQVALSIKALAGSGHFRLVETLAGRIARLLIDDFGAPWVKVNAAKIAILPNAKFVGVSIERRKT